MASNSIYYEIQQYFDDSTNQAILFISLYGKGPEISISILVASAFYCFSTLHIFSGCLLPFNPPVDISKDFLSVSFSIGFPSILEAQAFAKYMELNRKNFYE